MIQRAADVGVPAGLITAARDVNRSMPSHVAGVLSDLIWNAGVPAGDAKGSATRLVIQSRSW